MPTNHPAHPADSASWADVLTRLHAAGAADGRAAAEWWAQDAIGGRATGDLRPVAARVLAGLDDADPAVADALPACDLSGRAADAPTAAGLYRDHAPAGAPDWDGLDHHARGQVTDAYRDGYDTAVGDHAAAACQAVLDPDPDTDPGPGPRTGGGTPRPTPAGCGCPPDCVLCQATVGAGHDDDCDFRAGSARHETPVVAAAATVDPAHTHRPGCPHVARRPGPLFDTVGDDERCTACGAVNTRHGASFRSYGGSTEHHERCTACGQRWGDVDLSAVY